MQAGVLYRIPAHNFTELTCIPSLVCGGYSSKYFAGKALALTVEDAVHAQQITQKKVLEVSNFIL